MADMRVRYRCARLSTQDLFSKDARRNPLSFLENLAEVGGILVPAFLSNLRDAKIKAAQELFSSFQP